MTSLFFYGTLRHLPLLHIVMGQDASGLRITPATVAGYTVFGVAEGPFPTIVTDQDGQAEGILVEGLTDGHLARLNFYEGGFDYDLVPATLTNGIQTQFYMSQPDRWTPTDLWSLEAWIAAEGAANDHAAEEVMGYFGTHTRDQVAALFPRIRARAASRARAGRSIHGSGTLQGSVDVETRTRVHSDFYGLDVFELRHAQFDGSTTDLLNREVFVPSDAALILPYDPKRDCVLVVEQMRMGPLGRGDKCVWQLEPIAGLIDPGETPEQTAHREAFEEAGVTLHGLEAVAQAYSSPGSSAEFCYSYVGLADLPEGTESVGGLASEGEDIRSHIIAFDDLMDRIARFDIANTPLIMTALWLAKHRGRLRSQ